MNFAAITVLFCVTVCSADYSYEGHAKDYFAPANYKFEYGVNDPHTGDKKSQYESRHGDAVKGAYSINDPDGTVRVVEYTSDPHSGFNAVVKRIGHASHPQHYKTYNDAGHEAHHGGYNNGGYNNGGYKGAASSYASINNYAQAAGHGYY